jgi:modulator of FtsH protease
LQEWQVFYATVAAACATLTGLLFVALSINVDILNRAENVELMWLARQTFGEFLFVLMIALLFLIPHRISLSLGVSLLALGIAWTFSTGKSASDSFRKSKAKPTLAIFLRRFGLSLAGALGIVAVSIAMLLEWMDALYFLVFMLAALLASASRNAWHLLVRVREIGQKQS